MFSLGNLSDTFKGYWGILSKPFTPTQAHKILETIQSPNSLFGFGPGILDWDLDSGLSTRAWKPALVIKKKGQPTLTPQGPRACIFWCGNIVSTSILTWSVFENVFKNRMILFFF